MEKPKQQCEITEENIETETDVHSQQPESNRQPKHALWGTGVKPHAAVIAKGST